MAIWKNLDETHAYKELKGATPFDVRTLDAARVRSNRLSLAAGLEYSWAAAPVDSATVDTLARLARELGLAERFLELAGGAIANPGEQRRVLHHLLRGELVGSVVHEGRDQGAFYREQLDRFSSFAERVRSGKELGSTGKPFRSVVQIGIGGSDLGPRALYLALETWARAEGIDPVLDCRFISNVDPDDAVSVMRSLDVEQTLFVLVSKSGTTQETLTNEQFVTELARSVAPEVDVRAHTVAVTSETSPMATGGSYRDAFFIDDYIGGRYSATSAVGGVMLSLAFGPEVFRRVLAGAHEADRAALESDVQKNATMLDALIGVYERNILQMGATAVLPYSQALSRFPAHLQQLDMESNGKSVSLTGAQLSYDTGPLVFGEPGTNGQHSFYQLLHQGTTIVPLQFIGFRSSQAGSDTTVDGSTSQVKLNANLAAQIVAFATGRDHEEANKRFAGGRPSTLIVGDRLDPESLGALLAHYENKVMFQGFVWNINSFDQEGVQLGKILTKSLLNGEAGPELTELASFLAVDR